MSTITHNFAIPSTTLPVSLLVPDKQSYLLAKRLKKRNVSLRSYLTHRINTALCGTISVPPPISNVNTLYQRPGLNLIRLSVRLPASLWCQFRSLARSRGVSVCYLFVFLIGQDNENEKIVGTTTPEQMQFQEMLNLVRKILRRKLQIDLATVQ